MPNVNLPLGSRGLVIPANSGGAWFFPDGTWTLNRGALGNWFTRKTAGAATTHPSVDLAQAIAMIGIPTVSVNLPLGVEEPQGGLLTGFDLIYAIGTAGLTSLTPTATQTKYVHNTAPNINNSPGGAISVVGSVGAGGAVTPLTLAPVATSPDNTKPYVIRFAFASPYIIGASQAEMEDFLEFAVVDPGTSVFDIYGVNLLFNANR